jgi:hypothetical protein
MIFKPFDTQYNFTRTLIIHFLCVDKGLFLKTGIKIMFKKNFDLREFLALLFKTPSPIEIESHIVVLFFRGITFVQRLLLMVQRNRRNRLAIV